MRRYLGLRHTPSQALGGALYDQQPTDGAAPAADQADEGVVDAEIVDEDT